MTIYRSYIKIEGKYGEDEINEYFADKGMAKEWLNGWAERFGFLDNETYKKYDEFSGYNLDPDTDFVWCYLQEIPVKEKPGCIV